MSPDLLLPIALLFISIAVIVGLATSSLLARNAPERRRLRTMAFAGPGIETLEVERQGLIDRPALTADGRRIHRAPATPPVCTPFG